MKRPTAMTIAGSDSSGGAGIQADIKTMSALGVHGTSAITSVTAQNTLGVAASLHLPVELVAAQIDAIVADVGADAAKTGMLATRATIETVAERMRRHRIAKLVVDPVMVATSGARLMEDEAVSAMKDVLLPLSLVVTPNVAEAGVLGSIDVTSREAAEDAARAIADLGPRFVLLKGGHTKGDATDLLFDGRSFTVFSGRRIGARALHGTGCTLSAALAAGLALGLDVPEAVGMAKSFVTGAIEAAFALGAGSDFLDHSAPSREGCE